MRIPNSFRCIIFGRHKVQYEFGSLGDHCSNVFFFLPSTVNGIEKIDQHLGSVNLNVVDIDIKDFGENFDPSV